ncbi:toxic anion resistance protein [Epilithonimonas ginsengisoli]|uniref:Toxic anion resistance protein n=1 Tax=Epilithonimonas ginsengisoli TaxID=1245592 RepID=A0ABU4JJ13_9FLAO|nr:MULTISPECIES: toxic anion resistance protein [Chryseobacterium group]MBV6880223.1 toxic anion resistance protein [Epilithonimonas sp. FP105]MDW8549675.1 toxic anion resistance protein [Epilithonimonas ginsengisoli]OAH72243.1 tellurite resistance protein [Chryseobacterium sp. FP211-J200]
MDLPQVNNAVIDKNGNVDLAQLATTDVQKYDSLSGSIDEQNPNSIINFGSELQNSLANQSDSFLNNVRKSNSGEVGDLINKLLVELNYVDVDEIEGSSVKKFLKKIPFLNKMVSSVETLFVKYDKIVNNISDISNKVNAGIINSTKDNAVLQTIFTSNIESVKKIEDYIIAGSIRMQKSSEELALMETNAANYQDYQISDKRDFINRLDRRLADLKVVRFIILQSLPQIRLIQNNNVSIAEKAQTILTTTLPVWKNQLTLAVAMHRQQQNIDIQKKVSSTTEEILRKNAQRLQQNTVDVARANEQTIVSVETLRETTSSLINTLNEVKQIQQQGTQQRQQLDVELKTLEDTLKKQIQNS